LTIEKGFDYHPRRLDHQMAIETIFYFWKVNFERGHLIYFFKTSQQDLLVATRGTKNEITNNRKL
jgi:hypothetical protein